jgi:hypothetical protein
MAMKGVGCARCGCVNSVTVLVMMILVRGPSSVLVSGQQPIQHPRDIARHLARRQTSSALDVVVNAVSAHNALDKYQQRQTVTQVITHIHTLSHTHTHTHTCTRTHTLGHTPRARIATHAHTHAHTITTFDHPHQELLLYDTHAVHAHRTGCLALYFTVRRPMSQPLTPVTSGDRHRRQRT